MNNPLFKSLLGASCAVVAMVGAANAGGLERGGYNIDLLFDPSRFAAEAAATYVMPDRELNNVVDINPANGIGSNGIGGGATNGVERHRGLLGAAHRLQGRHRRECRLHGRLFAALGRAHQPWRQLDGRQRQHRNQDRQRQLRGDLLLQDGCRQGSVPRSSAVSSIRKSMASRSAWSPFQLLDCRVRYSALAVFELGG